MAFLLLLPPFVTASLTFFQVEDLCAAAVKEAGIEAKLRGVAEQVRGAEEGELSDMAAQMLTCQQADPSCAFRTLLMTVGCRVLHLCRAQGAGPSYPQAQRHG